MSRRARVELRLAVLLLSGAVRFVALVNGTRALMKGG
jgi:hypothetical protein